MKLSFLKKMANETVLNIYHIFIYLYWLHIDCLIYFLIDKNYQIQFTILELHHPDVEAFIFKHSSECISTLPSPHFMQNTE